MKYAMVLLALAVVCLLAAPGLAAKNGNGNMGGSTDCPNVPPLDGSGNQYGNPENWNPDGDHNGDHNGDHTCDGDCQTGEPWGGWKPNI